MLPLPKGGKAAKGCQGGYCWFLYIPQSKIKDFCLPPLGKGAFFQLSNIAQHHRLSPVVSKCALFGGKQSFVKHTLLHLMGSRPASITNKAAPQRGAALLVRATGLEPARSRSGT